MAEVNITGKGQEETGWRAGHDFPILSAGRSTLLSLAPFGCWLLFHCCTLGEIRDLAGFPKIYPVR